MRKSLLLYLCCFLVGRATAAMDNYQSSHFTVCTDLDPAYVQFIQANAEAYYENLQRACFTARWPKPLLIYYSASRSQTRQLINEHGRNKETAKGRYVGTVPAIYVYRLGKNGQNTAWANLFHETTHHFIRLNYDNPPAWFDEGLACFLGEQTAIVKGQITAARPQPARERTLRDKIESGSRISIRRLFSAPTERFADWDVGPHFAAALFYWLHETGRLHEYLKNVKQSGYQISVLEETVGKSSNKINIELLKFIKANNFAGAFLQDGLLAEDATEKKQFFLKALELKPNYKAARLELAKCCYLNSDYQKTRGHLTPILNDPEAAEHQQAAYLMGNTYYSEKNYFHALEYYTRAWEYSDYSEDKFKPAYKIANCYYHLKNPAGATQWYRTFLDQRWDSAAWIPQADYARKYLGLTELTPD